MAKTGFNTKFYFDKKAVIDAVGKAKADVMGRQGALVRTVMKRSMRKRKGHAPAGQPPYRHQGSLAKIEFAYDPKTQSVVIGPAKLGNGSAPEVLDKGGAVKVKGILNRKGQFIPLFVMKANSRAAAVASGKVVTRNVEVKARPFSQPALMAAKSYLAKPWKGAVKK